MTNTDHQSQKQDQKPKNTQEEWDAFRPRLNDHFQKARHSQYAHYAECNRLLALDHDITLRAAVLTGIGGASATTRLADMITCPVWKLICQIAIGFVTLAGASYATVAASSGFAKTASKHKASGSLYASVRRRILSMVSYPVNLRESLEKFDTEIGKRLDDLASTSDTISKPIWDCVEEKLKRDPSPLLMNSSNEEIDDPIQSGVIGGKDA